MLRALSLLSMHAAASAEAGSQLFVLRPARASPDLIGLDSAKAVLSDAVVLPAQAPPGDVQLFSRSAGASATLLVGPSGLGKALAAEAAAAAAGAQVLQVQASEAEAEGGFCKAAVAGAEATEKPVVVLLERLEARPSVAWAVGACLREAEERGLASRLFVVTTLEKPLQALGARYKWPFGHIAQLALPTEPERTQYLKQLLTKISRVDPLWGSALREAAVGTLANITESRTFTEIDLLVRRAFLRSANDEGTRDPVALHHFEQILADMPPTAFEAFNAAAEPPPQVALVQDAKAESEGAKKKSRDPKESKDPMDGIFGRCNAILPEALHLPPIVWAMIIFGILAHFMARTTYQSYGGKRKRGAGARSALFGDGQDPMAQFAGLSDRLGGLGGPGGNPFANFPPPPNMPRAPRSEPSAAESAPAAESAGKTAAADAPSPSPTTSPTPLQPQ